MLEVQYCQVVSSLQKYIKKQNNIFYYDFAKNDDKFYVIQAMFPHGNIDKRCCIRQSVSACKVNLDACIRKTSLEHNHKGLTI